MAIQNEKNTAGILTAENEGTITPVQLLQEIQPLLEDYFIGKFKIENNALNLSFKNGQTFRLVIGEVK